MALGDGLLSGFTQRDPSTRNTNLESISKLTAEQLTEIRNFDSELTYGTNFPQHIPSLQKIHSSEQYSSQKIEIHPEFFLSDDADESISELKYNFLHICNEIDNFNDKEVSSWEDFFQKISEQSFIDKKSLDLLSTIQDRSRKFITHKLAEQLVKEYQDGKSIKIQEPKKLIIVTHKQNLTRKIEALRVLKQHYKEIYSSLDNDELVEQKLEIIRFHVSRLNIMLSQSLIQETLAYPEKYKTNLQDRGNVSKRRTSLLNRFQRGIGDKKRNSGDYSPFTKKILFSTAKARSNKLGDSIKVNSEYEYLNDVELSPEQMQRIMKELLNRYNLLFDSDIEITFNRAGKISTDPNYTGEIGLKDEVDSKYQVGVRKGRTSMSVDTKRNIVNISSENRNALNALSVILHEFIHVLQSTNKNNLGLASLEEFSGARSSETYEGGALYYENEFSLNVKGEQRKLNTGYAAALTSILRGGGLVKAAKAYINNEINLGAITIDSPGFIKEVRDSVARAMRFFRESSDYKSEQYPLRTSDLKYAESVINAENNTDLTRLMVGGINQEQLDLFVNIGLVSLEDIIAPDPKELISLLMEITKNIINSKEH